MGKIRPERDRGKGRKMDDSRSSTGPPWAVLMERPRTGTCPVVVRERAMPDNVCDLLARFLQGSMVGNVRVIALEDAPPRGRRIALMFEAAGTFVPMLLQLIKEVVIDGRHYFRLPRLDGEWWQGGTEYVVEMGILLPKHGKRLPPLQSDNVRLVFRR